MNVLMIGNTCSVGFNLKKGLERLGHTVFLIRNESMYLSGVYDSCPSGDVDVVHVCVMVVCCCFNYMGFCIMVIYLVYAWLIYVSKIINMRYLCDAVHKRFHLEYLMLVCNMIYIIKQFAGHN